MKRFFGLAFALAYTAALWTVAVVCFQGGKEHQAGEQTSQNVAREHKGDKWKP